MNPFTLVVKLIRKNLVFHEIMHGVIALPFATLLWTRTKSLSLVLVMFAVTYLIDLDHLVDYFKSCGLRLNPSEFLGCKYFNKKKISYIPFHAWEWLLILGIVILIGEHNWHSYFVAVFMGILPHYLLDSLNVGSLLFYSIIYRYTVIN